MTKDFFKRDPLFLAPLAGFSDPPLRGVVKKFGCDATVSEMINANALVFEGEKTLKMLEKNAAETPFLNIWVMSKEAVSPRLLICWGGDLAGSVHSG